MAQDSTDLVPIEHFFEEYNDYEFVFSPDGSHLAYIVYENLYYYLAITDLNKYEVEHYHLLSSTRINKLYWLNNDRLLYEYSGKIGAINADGSEHRILINYVYDPSKIKGYWTLIRNLRTWNVVSLLPKDRENILVSSIGYKGYMSIHKINIYTGEKIDLIDGKDLEINLWFSDPDGNIRIGARIEKGVTDLFTIKFKNDKPILKPLSLMGGKFRIRLEGNTYLEKQFSIENLSTQPNIVYISENITGDKYRLVEYDLEKDAIVKVIAEDPDYDIGGPDVDLQLFIDKESENPLIGYRYNRDKPHTVWIDERFKKAQDKIDRKYGDKINLIYGWTDNKDKFLLHSSNEKTKGRVCILDVANEKVIIQSFLSPTLEKFKLGETEVYKYKTRDGYTIESYLTRPADAGDKPLPLIVMPHGGPTARDIFGYDPYVQFFTSRGYAVLQPNYRGSIGYGFEHLKSGFRQLADLMIDDIHDAALSAIQDKIAQKERIYILGFSYGGYAAIVSSIRYPDTYKAAVSASAPLDMVEQLKKHKDSDEYFAYDFWRNLVGDPKKEKKVLRSISPYYRVSDIKVPLILFHGKDDPVILAEQLEEFEKVKDKAPVEIETVMLAKEGHGFSVANNNIYFLEKSLRHFEKYRE